ncbi:MAG: pilus assembly protein PilZ [Salinisphaeraceae bacterium]|jgi:type IV pilus assembly protein PilZ|nr:pilus assembly protein PilZ [Salinisphaeraceae bacterium]
MAADKSKGGAQPGIVTLNITDKSALYLAYMPYVTNGGLFIPDQRREGTNYALGDEVFLLLNLVEQGDRLPVAGKVIWVTPPGAQGQRPPGIGIQFSAQDGGATQQKIETVLAGSVNADRPTHTM